MEARCPKCGLWQDPTLPQCRHMIGRKGGTFTTERADPGEMAKRGFLGAVAAGRTSAQFSEMGVKGGLALRDVRGYNYYREIGRKGGETRARRMAERKALDALLGKE